ncbi:MAG: hypothetical protein P4L73_13065 [Caulobacteraceae bacterium]|nr:hypothetical protein [Caulobacteraceae bacterium]
MNRFGEIADELTDLIEELERSDLAGESKRLRVALARAFDRACEADRSLRLKTEAMGHAVPPARRARQGHRATGGFGPSANVIELPAWRAAAMDRRPM